MMYTNTPPGCFDHPALKAFLIYMGEYYVSYPSIHDCEFNQDCGEDCEHCRPDNLHRLYQKHGLEGFEVASVCSRLVDSYEGRHHSKLVFRNGAWLFMDTWNDADRVKHFAADLYKRLKQIELFIGSGVTVSRPFSTEFSSYRPVNIPGLRFTHRPGHGTSPDGMGRPLVFGKDDQYPLCLSGSVPLFSVKNSWKDFRSIMAMIRNGYTGSVSLLSDTDNPGGIRTISFPLLVKSIAKWLHIRINGWDFPTDHDLCTEKVVEDWLFSITSRVAGIQFFSYKELGTICEHYQGGGNKEGVVIHTEFVFEPKFEERLLFEIDGEAKGWCKTNALGTGKAVYSIPSDDGWGYEGKTSKRYAELHFMEVRYQQ